MYDAPMGVAETTAATSRRRMVAARMAVPVRLTVMTWWNVVVWEEEGGLMRPTVLVQGYL